MKTLARFSILLAVIMLIPGCGGIGRQIGAKLDSMSDEELTVKVHDSSEGAVSLAMKLLVDKMPEKKAAILKDAAVASTIIKTNIIPIFNGEKSNEVVAQAIQTALNQLSGKISLEVDGAIRLGYGVMSEKVTIPQIPTDKLSPRVKGAVIAFFTGSSEALDMFAAKMAPPVSPPPITPPAPPK